MSLAMPANAHASDYPTKPIYWVVPSAAGGIADTSARVVARALSETIGQPVIIDNKPGAGGIVGTEYVSKAKPDGYTMLYASSGPMATNPSLYGSRLKYDPLKSFTPVQGLAESRMLLVVNPTKPFKSLPELVAYAKQYPGKVNYGSAGSGTAQHLSVELLKTAAGIDLTHVPYKSGSAEIADLISGVLDFAIEYPAIVRPYLETGKLVAIGMNGPTRFSSFPDVPTLVELGYPSAINAGWSTVALPANAPDDVVQTLSSAIKKALKDPAVVTFYKNNDSVSLAEIDPANIHRFIASEIERFGAVVKQSGAVPE